MKRKNIFFVVMIVNIFTMPLIAEWLRLLQSTMRTDIGKAVSSDALKGLISLKTYTNFLKFDDYTNFPMWMLCLLIIMTSLKELLISIKREKSYEDDSEYGSHGTARFQKYEEMKEKYTKEYIGWFWGSLKRKKQYKINKHINRSDVFSFFNKNKYCYHSVNGELNMQTVVVGAPGSNKTVGFVLPNIYHIVTSYKARNELIEEITRKYNKATGIKKKWYDFNINKECDLNARDKLEDTEKASVRFWLWWFKFTKTTFINAKIEMPDIVATDPKSEITSLTIDFLEENGYEVSILDFIYMKYGDTFNILEFIDTEKDLMEIAEGFVFSIDSSTGGNADGFWSQQEGQALAALMGAIKQTRKEDGQVLAEVLTLLTDDMVNKQDGSIDMQKARSYFVKNVKGAPLQLWKNFLMLSKSDQTAGNILGGLTGKLKLFTIKEVQNVTSSSTFNPRLLGAKKEKPKALFIFMSDSDQTFGPIINMILSTIFKTLYSTAREYNNKLYCPVYFPIDEMANIGKIAGMKEMLGTMRSRRIYPMMIWQSLAQMKERYGDAWEDIMSQCDTHIYLGANDNFTLDYISKSLGTKTIMLQGLNRNEQDTMSENKGYQARDLMKPEEVKKNSNDKMIIIQRARDPFMIYKVKYTYWKKGCEICKFRDIKDMPKLKFKERPERTYEIMEEPFNDESLRERVKDTEKERESVLRLER